ncbi:hypothetical protein F5B22DRAFT_602674 [Xylaria bambusicola]|uniref:uncharacterized protein n=1 Tax=Xylaria bambusicola TaxID=326684 RepID=UPI0020075D6F|nr:uncharacterized protein F5B22DRAFT_602674 [Xylaria bambusicola]KAI0517836.1 hypothetical protein F5B22DRAFT_602674 [Xylaria bambusicola]
MSHDTPTMADKDDDSGMKLREISRCHKKPIVRLLLDIQNSQKPQVKDIGFLKHLECFIFDEKNEQRLRRTWINVFEETNYVALSYTWNPSNYECKNDHGYRIQNRTRDKFFSSPVRNCVFQRIMEYMRAMGVDCLWIDRHSIPQKEKESPKKQKALQCMDLVYKLSKHPVALLGRELVPDRELTLLYDALTGRLVIRKKMTEEQHRKVIETLQLLYEITNDLWWQRAWTFQENYRGGAKMTLLIHHLPSDETSKMEYGIFGEIPGELSINSSDFSKKVTSLCRDIQNTLPLVEKREKMIESILSAAGRYTTLLDESQTMSPTIIADVEKRGVKHVWDRLPIVANCCSYPVRMDIENLRKSRHSVSLSMLTMCLLNGEILNNALSNTHISLDTTTSVFLKNQFFDKISSPGEEKSLTFNKGCRFINVKLTESGILTYGHLWEMNRNRNRVIRTDQFSRRLPWVQNPAGDLTRTEHQHLTQLCRQLRNFPDSKFLACSIKTYLKRDASGNPGFNSGENYMRMMMIEVASAIEDGKRLVLGRLSHSREYTAIFVCSGNTTPHFIFTSSQHRRLGTENHIVDDTDRHVSLVVDRQLEAEDNFGNLPHLYVKRWVSGISFFVGCRREKVIFPWPQVLMNAVR